MSEIVQEAERILSEPSPRVVYVPWDSHNDGNPTWFNVFLLGLRVGYVHFSASDGGWSVTLNKDWGAPRNAWSAVYLTKELALARIAEELEA